MTNLGYRIPNPTGPRRRFYRVQATDGSMEAIVQPGRRARGLAVSLAAAAQNALPGVSVRVNVGHAIGNGPVTWEGQAILTYTDEAVTPRPRRR